MITCLWEDDYEATKYRYYTRFPGYFFNGDMGMWDENRCYRHMRRTDDLIRINYKKTSVKFLNTIMNSYEGVEDSMIMSNQNCSKGYAWVITRPENRNSEFIEKFSKYLFDNSNGIGLLNGVIFIEAFPKTATGKVSRALMQAILNRQPHQISVQDRTYTEEVERICYQTVGDVNKEN